MRRALPLLLLACASSGPQPKQVSVGSWRASYRDWSGVDLCETETSWLRDELLEVNELLEKLDARGGAWRDDELPLLEDAAKKLPELIDSHERTLTALRRCPYASDGTWARAVSQGLALVARTRAELQEAPKLVQFVKHRHALEKWRETLSAEREAARSRCAVDAGSAEPVIYFAFGDELKGTTWLFCDGAVVNAPLTGSLELEQVPETWPAAKAKDLRAKCFELARVYPGGLIRQPPR